MEKQRRENGTEPQQQVVAPADAHRAQHTPQHRILEADVAVKVELFAGVVPPAAVVHPLQKFRRDPLHHRRDEETAREQRQPIGAQVGQTHRQQDPCRAIDEAERTGRHAAVGELAALNGGHDRLPHPAEERVNQINDAEGIKIQIHRTPFSEKQKGAGNSGSRPFLLLGYSWLLYNATISSTLVSRGLPGRQASA